MPKNLLQDIIKPAPTKKDTPMFPRETWYAPVEERFTEPHEIVRPPSRKHKYGLWIVAFCSVALLLFAVSYVFSYAKVVITPKTQDIDLNENFSATKDAADGLSFDLVIISDEESKEVAGGASKAVTTKAKGTVILYNAFSPSPQKLLIDTRLEGSNGKIYKTASPVMVPGMVGTTPGSIKVGIYADSGGEAYDSGPLDFKVLGFKGTAKYDTFYARSEGDIAGGFEGEQYDISDLDREAAESELASALSAKLLRNATGQIPDGFILFKDAAFIKLESLATDSSQSESAGMVTLSVKGTLYGLLFDEKKLTREIAKKVVDAYSNEPVHAPQIKDLIFSTTSPQDPATLKDISQIDFALAGPIKIIWDIDEAAFARDVVGKKKTDFRQILSSYPNIQSAERTLRPMWLRSFPDTAKKIEVKINESARE